MPKGSWHEFDQPFEKEANHRQSIPEKSHRLVRVQKTRGGKGGKIVTIISGLELDKENLKVLLKKLKAKCGTGGTSKEDCLELQGDHVSLILELLSAEGYSPKRSGG